MEQINNTTYALTISGDLLHQIEIGDSKQEDFYPQVKMIHWDNEANFSVRYNAPISGASYEVVDDKTIEWQDANGCKVDLYYIPKIEFELEVNLPSKPASNVIEYTIKTKNLVFYYQPSACAPDEYRPARIKGSYAVYHANKKDGQYKTGKAFHI